MIDNAHCTIIYNHYCSIVWTFSVYNNILSQEYWFQTIVLLLILFIMKHISAKPSALAEGNNVITENKIARHK